MRVSVETTEEAYQVVTSARGHLGYRAREMRHAIGSCGCDVCMSHRKLNEVAEMLCRETNRERESAR